MAEKAERIQTDSRLQALDSAMRQIEKDFGKGSIMRLGKYRQ
jgi:recombination protein RecA